MNRTTFGWIVGFVGASIGVWWWRQMAGEFQAAPVARPFTERGTVIFDNTPRPSGADLTL